MQTKFHSVLKKAEMVIFKSKKKKFEGDLKQSYVVKDYILLKVFVNIDTNRT